MKIRCFRHCCASFASVLLAFAMMTGTASAADTGVEGVISVSPARPGPQREGSADKAPVANTTFVVKQGDERVTSFTTDAAGHFQVKLPPGHYVVTRETASAIGRLDFEVEIAPGKMATVDWTGDSGMR
jgi:hypothetical protein